MPRFFAGNAAAADGGGATAVCTVGGDCVIATVTAAPGAAAWPRIGRQPAMLCGRSLARTASPASRPTSRPRPKPDGAFLANGWYSSSSMRSKALGGAEPVMA